MRVLVVDQDSASNEAIARSLRDLYTVDAVTNKGDCLDLLRSNAFEVIVAAERLDDGSGLELLGQIGKKYPASLRIFAADKHRLQLLRGRLGPFQLFQTLAWPIDPDKLLATLELAGAAGEEEVSGVQHVMLTSEVPDEALEDMRQAAEEEAFEQSDEASEPATAGSRSRRASAHGGGSSRAPRHRSSRAEASAAAPRSNGDAASVTSLPTSAARRATQSRRSIGARTAAAGGRPSADVGLRTGQPGKERPRSADSQRSRNGANAAGSPHRTGRTRSRAAKRPVRFPSLNGPPAAQRASNTERGQTADASSKPVPSQSALNDSFAEAAAVARAARSRLDWIPDEFSAQRLAVMAGGGLAVLAAIALVSIKLLGSHAEPVRPSPPPAVRAEQSSPAINALVAQTEAAFTADDFAGARADVDKLRLLSPQHPRLPFFEKLLSQQTEPRAKAPVQSAARPKPNKSAAKPVEATVVASASAPQHTAPAQAAASSAPTSTVTHAESPAVIQEVPPALTNAAVAASAPAVTAPASDVAASTPSAPPPAPAPTVATSAPVPATETAAPAAAAAIASVAAPAPRKSASGEPPPVVREAKLIKRVAPDYPSAAKRQNLSGSVDLDVTVSAEGTVEDAAVVSASPPDMFEKSALAAVRKWKYDPRFVDGLPAQAHLKVHLDFGP